MKILSSFFHAINWSSIHSVILATVSGFHVLTSLSTSDKFVLNIFYFIKYLFTNVSHNVYKLKVQKKISTILLNVPMFVCRSKLMSYLLFTIPKLCFNLILFLWKLINNKETKKYKHISILLLCCMFLLVTVKNT